MELILMTDSEIIQQWNDFIDDYEQKLQDAKQNSDGTIQDDTASGNDRFNSAKDYVAQEQYLKQLKSNRDLLQAAYDNGQPLPNVTFDVSGIGGACKSTTIPYIYSTVRQNTHVSGDDLVIFETDFADLLYRPEGGLSFSDNDISVITGDTSSYHAEGGKISATNAHYISYLIVDDKGYFNTQSSQSMYISQTGTKLYTLIEEVDPATFNFNNVPTLTKYYPGNYVGNVGGNDPIYYDSTYVIGKGIRYDYGEVTQDPYSDKPWDYYNDNIKDNISNPDNSVYPNGYYPKDPDEPGDEPQDLPHDDGEPVDNQEDRTLTSPTQFITQYILTPSMLYDLGNVLWSTWLTPNTTFWKNFVYHFNSLADNGTFDISMMFNFIISLRVFPFDFSDYTALNWISQTDGIYMGTGHTNMLPGNTPILLTTIGCIDVGGCTIKPETPYDDFRDMYNTSVVLYLPYCGTVELTPPEVMYREIKVSYFIDFQSGSCTAVVKLNGDAGWYNIATKSGQIGFLIPMTATNAGQVTTELIRDATQAAGTIGGFFFKMGKHESSNSSALLRNLESKLPKSVQLMASLLKTSNIDFGEEGFNAGLNLINQASNMLSRSGIDVPYMSGGSGAESMLFPDKCFVQIRRGKYCKPANYPHSVGHLNCSSNTIGHYKGSFRGQPPTGNNSGKGLCKFVGIDSTGLTCHDDERAEIISLLESGVYL
jgi:hypothetical protein